MQESALISVIIPTYNRAHLIGETIQSVIDQSFKNWELIIVDDGSTDDTKNRISEYNDGRIKYFMIEHSGIIAKVRNAGMRIARGDYIAFLDSDDLWEPFKLDYQISLLEQYPQVSFAFGHGTQFGNRATPTPEMEKFFVGNVFVPFLLEERFIFYVPTLVFRREVTATISLIDETLSFQGENEFFLRMANSFSGVFTNNIVARIRKHEFSHQSHSQSNELIGYDEYLVMLEKLLRQNRLSPRQFRHVASKYHYKLGLLYLKRRKSKRATKEFLRHIYYKPFGWKGWARLLQSLSTVVTCK
jgi:glycosyltransferase involved in cell wall biosynthesis